MVAWPLPGSGRLPDLRCDARGTSSATEVARRNIAAVSDARHLLEQLRLPSRYESLVSAVGQDVARLLVEPNAVTLDVFRATALHMKARQRGLFVPLFARSGAGKTTMVSSLQTWLAKDYGPTARLAGGEVTAARLRQAAEAVQQEHHLPANDNRIIVINVDDRESDPPLDKELSQIKSYTRESGVGSRTLIVWPETAEEIADETAKRFEARAGTSPVPIPAKVEGPAREAWAGIAIETLKLANSLPNLEQLGVDPRTYDPSEYLTLGDYLDVISGDFVGLLDQLIKSTQKRIRVVVAFASTTGSVGVLSELAGSNRYGLVDADRLLSATPNSVIGKWWKERAGLLVQTIVRLDARTVQLAPSLSVPIIRRYGPENAVEALKGMDIPARAPSEISEYFERSDFGRLLLGTDASTSETRGNPAHNASAAFDLLASEVGLGSGTDKKLNQAVADFLTQRADFGDVTCERRLESVPLIPDVALELQDGVTCLELHWRSGDYLTASHRSEAAQYILGKLKNYALELGWVSKG